MTIASSFFDNTLITQITSPAILDATNVYFGGLDATPLPQVFGVQRSSMTLVKTIGAATTVRTMPSWRINTDTYLYLGSDAVASQAHLYKMDITTGVVNQNNLTPTHSVTAPTTLINDKLHVGDQGGFMHGVDAISAGFTNTAGWPYQDSVNHPTFTGSISAMAYVDPATNNVYFGDVDGHFYVLTPAGVPLTASWPIKPTSDTFQNGALYVPSTGTIAAGTNNGKFFLIHQASHLVYFTYDFGAGVAISNIAFSSPQNVYLVGTSTGRLYYVTAR